MKFVLGWNQCDMKVDLQILWCLYIFAFETAFKGKTRLSPYNAWTLAVERQPNLIGEDVDLFWNEVEKVVFENPL